MRKLLITLALLLASVSASASGYGHYDVLRVLNVTQTPAGKKYGFNLGYCDQILIDLSRYAQVYPTRFETPQDKERAIRDVKALSGMLDVLVNDPHPSVEILLRAAHVHSMGHNLEIPGAAEKANPIFLKWLAIAPEDPQANYRYGVFLAGVGKLKEALPYLNKARAAGVPEATFSIGMTYLSLGDNEQALNNFEAFRSDNPNDKRIDMLIEAIRTGKVKIMRKPG